MLQVAGVHNGAGRGVVARHVRLVGVGLVAAHTSHDGHMVEACRNLLQTVRDQQHSAIGVLGTDAAQCPQRQFAAAQIQTRGRLVEDQQVWIGHQRPADQHARALPLRELEHLLAFQIGDAKLLHQSARLDEVLRRVLVAPTPRCGGQCGHHRVQRVLVRRERAGQLGRAQSDAVAVGEHIHLAQPVAEDVHGARGRESARAHHLHQTGFADAVGTEQHPFLAAANLQIHVRQDHAALTAELHLRKLQCNLVIGHRFTVRREIRGVEVGGQHEDKKEIRPTSGFG